MKVEWAWLRDAGVRHAQVREIVLERDGPCVVLLLHGLTGGPTELAYLAHFLHFRGKMTVLCPAIVNHGQPLAVLARTRWQELWESARQHFLAARAKARARGVPLFVGGLSMGAVLALMLAAEYPQDTRGVACLSPTLFYDGWNVSWMRRLLLAISDYTPFKYVLYLREGHPYGLKDEQMRAAIRARYESTVIDDCSAPPATYAHFPLRLLCEYRHLVARACERMPDVRAPVLVVQARDDDTAGPANAEYIRRHVSSPEPRVLLLENSYHIVTADFERERVCDSVMEFFQGLLGRSADASAGGGAGSGTDSGVERGAESGADSGADSDVASGAGVRAAA
jgi:carboxylesterase